MSRFSRMMELCALIPIGLGNYRVSAHQMKKEYFQERYLDKVKPVQYIGEVFRYGKRIYAPGNWEQFGKKRSDGTWKVWRRLFFGGRPSSMIERVK